ncbi:MAG: efflux RND transporter periplasmic adaptor subunit [Cryomorphaceae bacterium]|nr:efflux RND transporter periplasmic adaptor subunit [Cryomorphaceae bacterium]
MNKTFLLIATVAAAALASCNSSESANEGIAQLTARRDSLAGIVAKAEGELSQIDLELAALDSSAQWSTVTTLAVGSSAFQHDFDIYGTVKSDQSVTLYPESAGRIQRVLVRSGQKVSAGQVLVELDNSVVQSSLAEIKTQLDLAQTLFDKQKRLWDQGIGSEVQYLQVKTQLEGLQKRLATAQKQAAMASLRAPFAGTIDELFLKAGEYAAPGMAVARLVSSGGLRLELDVPETYISRLKVGQKIALNFNSIGLQTSASISQVGDFISADSRTFKVNVSLPANSQIKPNMMASAQVVDYSSTGIITVPSRLILQDSKGANYTYLFVPSKNGLGKVERRDLQLGVSNNDATEVLGGLSLEEQIIDRGIRSVQTGETVKAVIK